MLNKWTKDVKNKRTKMPKTRVNYIILVSSFWNHMIYALKVMGTLVQVYNLQITRKAMDIAYGLYLQQKSTIKYIYETIDKTKKIKSITEANLKSLISILTLEKAIKMY